MKATPTDFTCLILSKNKLVGVRLSVDDFIPLLEDAYGVAHPNNPAEEGFRSEIRQHVGHFLDQIIGAGGP